MTPNCRNGRNGPLIVPSNNAAEALQTHPGSGNCARREP